MARQFSSASGILPVVGFALQSGESLYGTVSSFQSDQSTIRGLREELASWNEVLKSLRQTATKRHVDFTSLKLPLYRCGRACEDLRIVLDKCAEHSSGSLAGFKDWEKVRYMGNNITEFKDVLACYKSTVRIVLHDVAMRMSTTTPHFLTELKTFIVRTASDLDEHLRAIEDRLHALSLQQHSETDVTEQMKLNEDRRSAEQCLRICTAVSAHVEQTQSSNTFRNISTPDDTYHTRLEAEDCEDLDSKLVDLYSMPPDSRTQAADGESFTAESDSVGQRLVVGADTSDRAHGDRLNIFEDISTADDGNQVLVSTVGYLISAKRVTAGARSIQLLGQMSDDSLSKLSQNLNYRAAGRKEQSDSGGEFNERYGKGWKLSTQTL